MQDLIGKRYTINGMACEVTVIRKRGRGWQVQVQYDGSGFECFRFREFQKVAIPV